MPDTTISPNPSEPASREGDPAARFTFDSGPREQEWRAREPESGHPLPSPSPSPWPQSWPDPPVTPPAIDMSGMDARGLGGGTADGVAEGMEIPIPRPDPAATRPLFAPEQWVSDPDFWETKTHIALTGRHPVPRPKTMPLRPPQRFHQMPRWKSVLILTTVCVLIALATFGAVEIGQLGTQVLGPSHTLVTPSAAPTHTIAAPTATPRPHKK